MNLEECKLMDRGIYLCEQGNERIFVNNVYPPIHEMQPKVLCVVIIFFLCFITGICGNASILTIIRGIMSERRNVRHGGSMAKRRESDNAILYLAALCLVDFVMSLSLPPAILDSIIGFWLFGTTVCKIHHVFGSVGRIISTFMITAMCFDRYVAVCHPYKTYYRTRKFISSLIITLWVVALILLLPMLTYASSTEVPLHHHRVEDPISRTINITRVRVYKCSDMMPPSVFYWFTSSTFVLGYLVPLILIVFFSSRLISKLYRHTKIIKKSGIPLKRITTYTVMIALVYFVCWTPYWCSVLYAIFATLSQERSEPGEVLIFIIYCVHILPYLCSASNWVLYGLLNTQLQVKHDVNQLNSYAGNNLYNNTNMGGSGSHIDDNISMSNMNHTLAAANGTTVRDGFLSSPDLQINRSASMLSNIGGKQNGVVFLKHAAGEQQYSSLTDLNNGK